MIADEDKIDGEYFKWISKDPNCPELSDANRARQRALQLGRDPDYDEMIKTNKRLHSPFEKYGTEWYTTQRDLEGFEKAIKLVIGDNRFQYVAYSKRSILMKAVTLNGDERETRYCCYLQTRKAVTMDDIKKVTGYWDDNHMPFLVKTPRSIRDRVLARARALSTPMEYGVWKPPGVEEILSLSKMYISFQSEAVRTVATKKKVHKTDKTGVRKVTPRAVISDRPLSDRKKIK